MSAKEPQSAFESLEELVALSAATGAHMHICHLNSSSGRDVVACAELIRGAQSRGLPITTEAYPYGAASTAIGAALLRGPDWLERCGANSADNIELNGRKLTQEKIDELQASQPGAVIVLHFLKPDDDARDRDLMDLSVLYPGAPIASDAMPGATPTAGWSKATSGRCPRTRSRTRGPPVAFRVSSPAGCASERRFR